MRISDWSSDVCSSDLPARRLPHLFQIDIRTVIRMLAEIVDIFRDTGGVVPKSRTDAIQVIANVGFRTPLADHAVDGGVGPRKGGIVRQARSEERRGGTECVSTLRHRWWAYH